MENSNDMLVIDIKSDCGTPLKAAGGTQEKASQGTEQKSLAGSPFRIPALPDDETSGKSIRQEMEN